MSSNATSDEEFLRKFNDAEYKRLIPVVVFMVILLVLGICGNSLVMYIYKFRFKRSSSRTFILCLALLDCLTCVIGVPYHMYDMANSVIFTNASLCKALSFLQTLSTLASIFVLGLISIDRYRKICKPFNRQISDLGTRAVCVFAIILAVICATPIIVLYGNNHAPIPNSTVEVIECYFADEYSESIYPLLYNGLFVLIFIGSTLAFAVMYSIIGYTIFKKSAIVSSSFRGSKRRGGDVDGNPESTNTTHDTISRMSEGSLRRIMKAIGNSLTPNHSIDRRLVNNKMEFSGENEHSVGLMEQAIPLSPISPIVKGSPVQKPKGKFEKKKLRNMSTASESEDDSPSIRRQKKLTRQTSGASVMTKSNRKHKRSVRITLMLFCVTLVFVLSFLPYLVVVFLTELDENYWVIGAENSPLLHFLMRTYFINNVANPFIYGLLDHRFRLEVAFLFQKIKKCGK